MKKRYALSCLLVLLFTVSCASGSTKHSSATPRENSRLLDEAAIQKTGFANAYQVIEALRPLWLHERASTSFGNRAHLMIYVDNQLMGGVETLKQIPTQAVVSMQYMDGMEASNRWGLNHGAGAILILTK